MTNQEIHEAIERFYEQLKQNTYLVCERRIRRYNIASKFTPDELIRYIFNEMLRHFIDIKMSDTFYNLLKDNDYE